MQILPSHLTTVTPPEVIALLPTSVAIVQPQGVPLPLHHLIIVGSMPRACSHITCERGPKSVDSESDRVKTTSAQTEAGSSMESTGPTKYKQHGMGTGISAWQRGRRTSSPVCLWCYAYHHVCFYIVSKFIYRSEGDFSWLVSLCDYPKPSYCTVTLIHKRPYWQWAMLWVN